VPTRPFEGHKGEITSIACSRDGKHILSGGADGTVRLWEADSGKEVQLFPGSSGEIRSVALSLDGKLALAGGPAGTWLWSTEAPKESRPLTRHATEHLLFLPGGSLFARCGVRGAIQLYKVADRRPGWGISAPSWGVVHWVDVAAGDNLVLYIPDDGKVHFRDLQMRKGIGTPLSAPGGFLCAAFSPDDPAVRATRPRVATGGKDRLARLWDLKTGKLLRTFKHQGNVPCLAFSPDGKQLLTGSEDGIVRLWDAATGTLLGQFTGHKGTINALAFFSDGQRAVSCGDCIKVWDLRKPAGPDP
jgi:WD40 repeat protein